MSTLEEIVGENRVIHVGNAQLLRYEYGCSERYVHVFAISDGLLFVKKCNYDFYSGIKYLRNGLYVTSVEDARSNRYTGAFINLKVHLFGWEKFGYLFQIRDYGLIYAISLGEMTYWCKDFNFDIASLIKLMPELTCNEGLIFDNVRVVIRSYNAITGKMNILCTNMNNNLSVSMNVSESTFNRLRPIDIVRSHKNLYPVKQSSSGNFKAQIKDITPNGDVIFVASGVINGKFRSQNMVMKYEEFKSFRNFPHLLTTYNGSRIMDDTFGITEQVYTNDIFYAMRDAGIDVDKCQFRGYFNEGFEGWY